MNKIYYNFFQQLKSRYLKLKYFIKKHIESEGKYPFFVEIRIKNKYNSLVWFMYTGEIAKTDENGNSTKIDNINIIVNKRDNI